MKKIPSFQVNHLNLQKGVYVSRKDYLKGTVLTTFDIRMKKPNVEPVMNTAEVHTIEHLGATFLRNHEKIAKDVIYFGPMGCRTGFYLILNGDLTSDDIIWLVRDMFDFIVKYAGEVPGASPRDCGNYQDMNLSMAKYLAKEFLNSELSFVYPE